MLFLQFIREVLHVMTLEVDPGLTLALSSTPPAIKC